MEPASVALLFSAVALVVALLAAYFAWRASATAAAAYHEPAPRPSRPGRGPDRDVDLDLDLDLDPGLAPSPDGAWVGSVATEYRRGPFTVRRVLTHGADLLRGRESEWVAYAQGERVHAAADLAEVLAWCEER